MKNFPPTYLYIKQHSITGKLYFGKTTKNPERYNGSGTKWLNHINYYGKQYVNNLWYCLFLDEKSINEFALSFSKQNDIVNSIEWLNLIEETGLGDPIRTLSTRQKMSNAQRGNTKRRGKFHTESAKEKNRLAHLGKKHTEESLMKLRMHSHSQLPETREKIRESLSGKKHTDERILNIKLAKLSKKVKWYTNGIIAKLFTPGNQPIGWKLGRKIEKENN